MVDFKKEDLILYQVDEGIYILEIAGDYGHCKFWLSNK